MINQSPLIDSRLCVHCGACGNVCPVGAISFKKDDYGLIVPILNKAACKECGICSQICPVEAFKFDQQRASFEVERMNILFPLMQCWRARCSNDEICYSASSAGVVRMLVQHAVNSDQANTVIALCENSNNPLEPQFKILTKDFDINELANSKYCPVSLDGVIRKLMVRNDNDRVLFVGLPCQIRAMKNIFSKLPQMRGRQFHSIGLFCKKTKDIRYSKYLAGLLGLKSESFSRFQFRGEGWPGNVRIKDGNREVYRKFDRTSISGFPWGWYLFSPIGCLFCYDCFAREADVSVGDPWLKEYIKNHQYGQGISLVVAHTQFGLETVEGCSCLTKSLVDGGEVIRSQNCEEIAQKIYSASGRLSVILGKNVSGVDWTCLMDAVWFLNLKACFEYIFSKRIFLTLPEFGFKILRRIPHGIFSRAKRRSKS